MDIEKLLEQSDLNGANLSGLSLGGRNLRGRNLRGANLSHAHLGGADLSGADLRNANLSNANLGAANLTGADLRFSDLRETNLNHAILVGADLREAIGLTVDANVPIGALVKQANFEVSPEYEEACNQGYHSLSHWGHSYELNDGDTLYKNSGVWDLIKRRLGDAIFSDRTTCGQVRLVRRYRHYSQWAYMISKAGFERIAASLGLHVHSKEPQTTSSSTS